VLLREDLAVLHWLDGAVVMVLVNLLVDRSVDLLMLVRLDGLVLHGRCNCLMNSGVVVAGAGREVLDGGSGFLHGEVV
jgi:hypothetical protein